MLVKTQYTTSLDNLNIIAEIGKHDLTQPTGNFFYDPWELKPEFIGTCWEPIWDSLPGDKGQARIIVLESPSCYTQHADIDDRYHLNLFGDEDYLIDLQSREMFQLKKDESWYIMDAGRLHTAISIGEHFRAQLVVRKLLTHNVLTHPISAVITAGGNNPRYHFDNKISPWLNRANKSGIIDNFKKDGNSVFFNLEQSYLDSIKKIIPADFTYEFM
jgi:hypothetical protein